MISSELYPTTVSPLHKARFGSLHAVAFALCTARASTHAQLSSSAGHIVAAAQPPRVLGLASPRLCVTRTHAAVAPPAQVRASGFGLLNAIGRMSSFVTTYAAGALLEVKLWAPLVVAAVLLALGSVAMMLLPEPAGAAPATPASHAASSSGALTSPGLNKAEPSLPRGTRVCL